MYHPSEWARYFDEKTGSYRYKHKGSGVTRDTFMAIGKVLKKNKTAEKESQKRKPLSQEANKNLKKKRKYFAKKKQPIKLDSVEKGSEKIWKILQERKPLSQDAQTKLNRILANKI